MTGRQSGLGDFGAEPPSDPFEFDQYGPTADRPLPEDELAALFESGGETIDRRAIPDSGLSLSDVTDWTFINDERENPRENAAYREMVAAFEAHEAAVDAVADRPGAEALTDGGELQAVEDDSPELTIDEDAEAVGDEWLGEPIHTMWGYGQTNVEFARIVDVSGTGKTVVAKRCKAERVDRGPQQNRLAPTEETFGDEFRLHVRVNGRGDVSFRGTYPSASDGDLEACSRRGTFSHFSDDTESVSETMTGYGH